MTVGEASAKTIINNTSARPSALIEISPKNDGQAIIHTKQSANIETNKNVVIALNGLQSL